MYRTQEGRERVFGEDALMHELDEAEEGLLDLAEFGEDEIDMLFVRPVRQKKARQLAR